MDVVCVEHETLTEAREALRSARGAPVRSRTLVRTGPDARGPAPIRPGTALPAGTRVLALPENPGFGAAANAGAGVGRAPWLLFLNPDCRLPPTGLEDLMRVTRRHPRARAVGPRLRGPGGREQRSHGVWPTSPWRLLDRPDPGRTPRGATAVDWLAGTCLLVSRDAFEGVGGFDERFHLYFEDVDLGLRLARAGGLSLLAPDVVAAHVGGTSFPSPDARARAWRRGRRTYLRKHAGLAGRALWGLWDLLLRGRP